MRRTFSTVAFSWPLFFFPLIALTSFLWYYGVVFFTMVELYHDISLLSSIFNDISLFLSFAQKAGIVIMYNSQITKIRIKELCKKNKVVQEEMLSACGLGINAIRQINDTKGISSYSLARIADYLSCSVDYLLGRTDNPEINR